MDRIYYFAYGSNLSVNGMCYRCPHSEPIDVGTVADHKLVFRGVADIVASEGDTAYGALWAISTKHCLPSLDLYEGTPTFYQRAIVDVVTSGGHTVKALTYKMVDNGMWGYEIDAPSVGYYNVCAEGYIDWELDLAPLRAARDEALEHCRRHNPPVIVMGEPDDHDLMDPADVLGAPKMFLLPDGSMVCEDCRMAAHDVYGIGEATSVQPWEVAAMQCDVCGVCTDGDSYIDPARDFQTDVQIAYGELVA